ncbi:AAA family ATPase [Candidatus Protochlamydia amoebophila]|uniref:AAA family ATPase n=1 Tax=Candidatus Protochlamydia amoebophila TaxID=362787 RepID=UPI001BC9F903|nr:AAA family ATPase [Candidatus Protochlamydia amoebophila]
MKQSRKVCKFKRAKIWLINEATKLGNRPMLQILKLAKQYDAQVVFSGGASQLPSVERGCLFDSLIKRYGSQKLENIQRQKSSSQKEITQKIARGEMAEAISQLIASKSIIWVDSHQDG